MAAETERRGLSIDRRQQPGPARTQLPRSGLAVQSIQKLTFQLTVFDPIFSWTGLGRIRLDTNEGAAKKARIEEIDTHLPTDAGEARGHRRPNRRHAAMVSKKGRRKQQQQQQTQQPLPAPLPPGLAPVPGAGALSPAQYKAAQSLLQAGINPAAFGTTIAWPSQAVPAGWDEAMLKQVRLLLGFVCWSSSVGGCMHVPASPFRRPPTDARAHPLSPVPIRPSIPDSIDPMTPLNQSPIHPTTHRSAPSRWMT